MALVLLLSSGGGLAHLITWHPSLVFTELQLVFGVLCRFPLLLIATLVIAFIPKSPNSARSPQAFWSTSALSVFPCLSQEPGTLSCLLEYAWLRLLMLHFSLIKEDKQNAMTSPEMLVLVQDVPGEVVTYPQAFRFSKAYVSVSTIPYFCPHALFGWQEGLGDRGNCFFLSLWSAPPPTTERVFPLLYVAASLTYIVSPSFSCMAFSWLTL